MTIPNEPPSSVARVFEEAMDRHGILDAEQLHDEFADPSHPLHSRYEWDNEVAGRKYRVDQIRGDIRSCFIRFIGPDDEEARVRRFTPVRYTGDEDRLRGYTRMSDVAANPLLSRALLREYARWLKQGEERFGHLKEYIELMQNGQERTG